MIRGLAVHQSGESRWVTLPARPSVSKDGHVARDEDGEVFYSAMLVFTEARTRTAFSARVVERLMEHDAAIFD